ncbi:MAG: sigma-70 family RNA polymerase sigma factor [Caldilineales bacterium]|nr:sigma-70 family RNA polymerase sigma factor [Caldilineales bacterium]MDW8318003.1 sigma-70 family RNA polymerase sigma factor [Anaerolineae bacterium]
MDEQALIQAACRGDLAAFNQLVLLYQGMAYNLAFRMLGDTEAAADATQEAFIKAYRNLGQYRGGAFRAWVLRIVTNVCYDHLRNLRRRPASSLEDMAVDAEHVGELVDPAEAPSDYALRQELGRVIQQAIARLPSPQRTVLILSDIEGLSYEEIAEVMQTSLGTVKSRLSRARAKVRDYLMEHQELLPGRYRLQDDHEP